MLHQTLLTLALTTLASAHFELLYPPTAGFVSEDEPQSPCGGASVNVDSDSPEVQVGQFAISVMSSHPSSEWQFSATTNTEPPFNFTPIANVVRSEGSGEFCLPALSAPEGFAGSAGVIQVVGSGHDGFLYQCAPVNFVSGSNTTVGSACNNATDFSAEFTTMEAMEEDGEALEDGDDDDGHSHSHGDDEEGHSHGDEASTTTAAAGAEETGDADAAAASEGTAATMGVGKFLAGGLGLLAAGFAL